MTSIVLIGTGNVARNLFDAFSVKPALNILQVVGRNKERLSYFKNTEISVNYKNMVEADIYIIAISDDALSSVNEKFNFKNKLLVHCSGGMPLTVLPATARRGSLYPVQTFTSGRKISFKNVPFCIEAENPSDLELISKLASCISDDVRPMSYKERQAVHLAAVFANNFTNYLFKVSSEICEEEGVPFKILRPLILETVLKLELLSPEAAQTGPARRGDRKTQEIQLNMIKKEEYRKWYRLFSHAIGSAYHTTNHLPEEV